MKKRAAIFLLFAMLLLSACGGGGSAAASKTQIDVKGVFLLEPSNSSICLRRDWTLFRGICLRSTM